MSGATPTDVQLTGYRLRRLRVPCDPPISDSQYTFDVAGVAYLELETDGGETGVGLGGCGVPAAALADRFAPVWNDLEGRSPFHLRGRLARPRGGEYGRGDGPFGPFSRAVDVALWDLCGKRLDAPAYELLGGADPAVPAYASGLAFDHDDETTRAVYEAFAERGFDAAKVKVGYDTVDEDLDRLSLVADALGDPTLAVDANEAWDPKEAIRRARAYRDAGFDLAWVEDPVLRDDVDGLRKVAENVPFAHVNAGEYVNFEGKRELLERGAVEMLNLRSGLLSTARDAAALGSAYGVPLHVGDAQCELGVHLAAALPAGERTPMEYWHRPWNRLTAADGSEGVGVEDGRLVAPDRPGHGVTLDGGVIEEYADGRWVEG